MYKKINQEVKTTTANSGRVHSLITSIALSNWKFSGKKYTEHRIKKQKI